MPSEPRWLAAAEVVLVNAMVAASSGEPFHVLQPDLLESACAAPHWQWRYARCEDVPTLAVHLLLTLARNHPFTQGNKRTAFQASLIFMQANGYDANFPDDEDVARLIIDVLDHRRPERELFDLFDRGVRPL